MLPNSMNLRGPKRTTYIFDVRDPDEYASGHYPGAVSAPGGQLVKPPICMWARLVPVLCLATTKKCAL